MLSNFDEKKDAWLLEELNIRPNWQKKGTYTGNIKFQNGVKMEFSLLLDHEKCQKMITVLQEEIVSSAQQLSEQMVKSMPIALPPQQTEETP